ncbi:MAG: NUDIX domain-containing protein [Candidatus Woesearchaeota archaeon]
MKVTVTGFLFNNNKVLFVLHKKLGKWMHVGGHLEEDEFYEEALKREVMEETNLEIQIINEPYPFGTAELTAHHPLNIKKESKEGNRKICIDFVALVKNPESISLQKEELLDYRWLREQDMDNLDTFEEIKKLAKKAFKIQRDHLKIRQDNS